MNDGGELRPEWLAVDSPAPKCVAELICLGFCSQLDKYFVRAQCYPSSGALLRNVPDACCMNLISGFHSCYTTIVLVPLLRRNTLKSLQGVAELWWQGPPGLPGTTAECKCFAGYFNL